MNQWGHLSDDEFQKLAERLTDDHTLDMSKFLELRNEMRRRHPDPADRMRLLQASLRAAQPPTAQGVGDQLPPRNQETT